MLPINIEAVRLSVRAVSSTDVRPLIPIESEPLQIINKPAFETRFAAIEISVLDAQDHRPAGLAGEQPVEKGSARVAHVEMAGRRRREADADGIGHENDG